MHKLYIAVTNTDEVINESILMELQFNTVQRVNKARSIIKKAFDENISYININDDINKHVINPNNVLCMYRPVKYCTFMLTGFYNNKAVYDLPIHGIQRYNIALEGILDMFNDNKKCYLDIRQSQNVWSTVFNYPNITNKIVSGVLYNANK